MAQSDSEKPPEERYPCPKCAGGVLRLRYETHFTWLHNVMITVPDFPVWVCDLCGHREDDVRAKRWLSILLSPTLGRPTVPRQEKGASSRRPQSSESASP